jgi:hypothetical protein
MTDFTNLAALVAQGQSLLDLVKGGHITQLEADNAAKLGEVDAALALKIAQANTAIANATAPINDKIPRIQLTKNQELVVSSGTVPDDVVVRSGVSFELVTYVSKRQSDRSTGARYLLDVMESDVKEQFSDFDIGKERAHPSGWNVLRVSWDFSGLAYDRNWLIQNKSVSGATATNYGSSTSAALVKLEEGEAAGFWASGCEVGKWRFCSNTNGGSEFGGHRVVHVTTLTKNGSMLIALPVTVSGVIAHPHDLFKNIEIL